MFSSLIGLYAVLVGTRAAVSKIAQTNKIMLYEVALIEKPTPKEVEEGKQEKLVLAPTAVIAKDDKSAGVQAVIQNRDKLPEDLSRVEVLVRPFA